MIRISPLLFAASMASPVFAEETRQLEAHEHGVGQLNVAFDGPQVSMELHAPGADIVGFEYAPESAEDRAAVDAAVATLASPLNLFAVSDAAGCTVVQASAELESEEENEDDHDNHDDHDDHGDKENEHAKHEEESGHTEFHAQYLLNCSDPAKITEIAFAYFDSFPNALEVEVQIVSDTGATAFEVERDEPTLSLQGLF